ncbi:hypothetical protein [Pasteurella multocida]|uniref:hypothetical protein n=1 Tax=Pasteurella multocida TaxID=747 RepID=UPI00146136C2|nr:hypothetical protein [Pasteurella multocida]NMR52370.1 hypothetical protein [Pasteurella multocida]NMR62310.1 hypothetical protein [Pasteurella multocida]
MLEKLAGGINWGKLDKMNFSKITRLRKKTQWGDDSSCREVMGKMFVRKFYKKKELGKTSKKGYSRIKAN